MLSPSPIAALDSKLPFPCGFFICHLIPSSISQKHETCRGAKIACLYRLSFIVRKIPLTGGGTRVRLEATCKRSVKTASRAQLNDGRRVEQSAWPGFSFQDRRLASRV